MPRLINRNKQVPGGMKFYDPNLRWSSQPWASFQVICDTLRVARLANPGLTAAKGLATDPVAIADEVDQFIAANCAALGQTEYITGAAGGGAPVPFSPPQPPRSSLAQRSRNLAVGALVSVEWLASGAEAVPVTQAVARAEVCSKCPLNDKEGDWLAKFTQSAQDAIRAQLNRKREMKLETPFDEQLGSCTACDCPMALKIWFPLERFLPKMLPAAKEALNKENPTCWILQEPLT